VSVEILPSQGRSKAVQVNPIRWIAVLVVALVSIGHATADVLVDNITATTAAGPAFTPTANPTPTPTFNPICETDADCRPGKRCRAILCRLERPCDDSDPTIDRLACVGREVCVDRSCECVGDCDRDGYVYVTEANRAVRIVLGEAALTACPAADADGDGTVTVGEVLQAIVNLGEGCLQEAMP